jgi:prepilin peptidase CpaA
MALPQFCRPASPLPLETPMPLLILTVGQIAGLAVAAASDMAKRTIPDAACFMVGLCGLLARVIEQPRGAPLSIGVAVLLFAALTLLHAAGLLGGGDVKLLAACALGPPPVALPRLLMAVVMTGGVLGAVHLAMRHLPRPAVAPAGAGTLRRVYAAERWRILRHAPLPYGVAIAAGGVWTLLTV